MSNMLPFLIIFLIGIIVTPNAFAETANVPAWIKNNAGWWASDMIDDSSFLQGIQYLIKEGIMVIPPTGSSASSQTEQSVPAWVKNTAGWWADDLISETEFVNSLQYLIEVGIIVVPQAEKAETTLKIPGYPDWLINNPSWQTAREVTNSDFTSFDTKYRNQSISKCTECVDSINNHGFRGKDFSKEKLDNTYRIFAVGGSTTFGSGVSDNETWPIHLQKKFEKVDFGFEVEVINAGVPKANSSHELQLIKEKIVNFEPDLVIMYDGVNDSDERDGPPIYETVQNWKSACQLGNERGFKTIIIVQADSSTGNRVLTISELIYYSTYTDELLQKPETLATKDKLHKYPEKLVGLTECTDTANFAGVFDYSMRPIYFDITHTDSAGNQIIANKIFQTIISHIGNLPSDEIKEQTYDNYKSGELVIYAAGSNFSEKNFESLDLKNAIFYKSNLTRANFVNTNLENADFRLANLNGVNFKGANLENALFHFAKFDNVDISQGSLSKIDLRYTDLSGAILTNTDLSDKDLTRTNLSGQDVSGHDLTNTILAKANLSNTKLPDSGLAGKDLTNIIFNGADLSGKDLSNSDFSNSKLDGANMKNADLTGAKFVDVDFTKIKNKSLAGADLTFTSLAYSNLSGVSLDGAILLENNFKKANLSGIDFTVVSNASIYGSIFHQADLSNANFEGMSLFDNKVWVQSCQIGGGNCQADWADKSNYELTQILYSSFENKIVIGKEIVGNELVIRIIFVNNFNSADLNGANFSSTNLSVMQLSNANLRNADLRNADLTNANLTNADLRNADLTEANLQNTIVDGVKLDGAILKCKNNPICVN